MQAPGWAIVVPASNRARFRRKSTGTARAALATNDDESVLRSDAANTTDVAPVERVDRARDEAATVTRSSWAGPGLGGSSGAAARPRLTGRGAEPMLERWPRFRNSFVIF